MIPLLRHLYPRVHYYPCHIAGRLAEDCWQVGALSVTFRPVWLWAGVFNEIGWINRGREWWIDTPWVSLSWND